MNGPTQVSVLAAFLLLTSHVAAEPSRDDPVKVFILAGQSNMVGFGQLRGGPGTMETGR